MNVFAGAMFLSRGSIEQSLGPIFLSGLLCTGREPRLQDCRFSSLEHTFPDCQHLQDVGIMCTGVPYN